MLQYSLQVLTTLALLFAAASGFGAGPALSGFSDRTTQRMNVHMKKVVVVGGTGYIGKYVVKESVKRGYETIVVLRPGAEPKVDYFAGAKLVYADVCDEDSIKAVISEPVDAVVSCLASSEFKVRVSALWAPLSFTSVVPESSLSFA